MTFPPQVLLQLTEGGEEEISVHDHVYKHIDESWYDTVYSCNSCVVNRIIFGMLERLIASILQSPLIFFR